MWRANGNPNHCTDLDEILHTHPHMSKEGFIAGLTPTPSPRARKLKETFLTCSAGCKLTRAEPGTSASKV